MVGSVDRLNLGNAETTYHSTAARASHASTCLDRGEKGKMKGRERKKGERRREFLKKENGSNFSMGSFDFHSRVVMHIGVNSLSAYRCFNRSVGTKPFLKRTS